MYTRKKKILFNNLYIIFPLLLIIISTSLWAISTHVHILRKCNLHPVVSSFLDELSIQNCSITQKSNYDDISYFIITPTVTKAALLSDKKISSIITARKNILGQLLSKYDFDLDNNEVANYSLNIVESHENSAFLYNMSLENYCETVLGIPYTNFYDMCYLEGEQLLKTYLIIGAIGYDLSSPSEDYSALEYEDIENRVYNYFIETNDDF